MAEKQSKRITPHKSVEKKLGLALSGGGFRAAFFHIGVLAQMADLGLLRRVEVISTVSGGSILGALYYLRVKRLLENKNDSAITDRDYQEIIARIEQDFLKGVQCNLRMRTFRNPFKNLRMSLANYSRSDRIGELYDELFYRPVVDPKRSTPIEMRELKITPKVAEKDFHPLKHNAGRRAKAPMLLINATTLNTGRNWRFEAVRMGEPLRSDAEAKEIDTNTRLGRPPSYDALTPQQRDIELGLAVAASACVPGIFPPLAISGLYVDDTRVQLVDGGIHDNQGIEGLRDLGCTCFIVSDASQQLAYQPDPGTQGLAVTNRSFDISMERVRQEEVLRLLDRPKYSVAFMHLRRGLTPGEIPWITANRSPTETASGRSNPTALTEFGVAPEVQNLLSRVRTDLDSFTEVEAYSLMLDGYKIGASEFSKNDYLSKLVLPSRQQTVPWRFLEVGPWMAKPTRNYLRQLAVAEKRLFKIFRLSGSVRVITAIVSACLLYGLWEWIGSWIQDVLDYPITLGGLLIAVIAVALGFVPWLNRLFEVVGFLRSPARFLVRALLPAAASVFVAIHLWIFDRLFLRYGKIKRLKPPS